MATINERIETATESLEASTVKVNRFADGDAAEVIETEGGPIPSIAGLAANGQTQIDSAVEDVQSRRTLAITAIEGEEQNVAQTAAEANQTIDALIPQIENDAQLAIAARNAAGSSASSSAGSATEAQQAATAAQASANYAGRWSELTGALSAGVSVFHEGVVWVLLNDVADVATSEPGTANPDWLESGDYLLRRRIESEKQQLNRSTIYSDFAGNFHRLYNPTTKRIGETDLEDNWTVERTSGAWGFDASGRLVEYAPDEARLVIEPEEGFLIEGVDATNLIPNSRDTSTYFTISGDVDPAAGVAPNGEQELGLFVGTAANARFGNTISLDENSVYCYAAYVERPANTDINATIFMLYNDGSNGSASLDFSTGQVTLNGGNPLDFGAIPYFKGYILWITGNTGAGTSPLRNLYVRSLPAEESLLFWGAQCVKLPYPVSIIPTSGVSLTRTADSVSRTLGDEFNSSEGTFIVNAKANIGDVILNLDGEQIICDSEEMKTYTLSYTDSAAATVELLPGGNGTIKSLKYEPRGGA